ncbi:group II intron maturase-specific domain-containing protein [Pseudomonas veronii]|uniref:group II intron maturase-specific domain-containing protein n=1 Tax=Pseudomonas veronii TaxID=76761 RepID=UPI003D814069
MVRTVERINRVLRGWASYFKLSQGKRAFEKLDGWVRHKLRCVLWRQWNALYKNAQLGAPGPHGSPCLPICR